MNQPITCLCLIPLKHLSIALVAVGMQGGAIHLYHSRHPVDYITAPDTPSAIAFGQLGQEEHVMVIITTSKWVSLFSAIKFYVFDIHGHFQIPSKLLKFLTSF